MELYFREANTSDFDEIIAIAGSHYRKLGTDGFLVKIPDKRTLETFIKNKEKEIYVAHDECGVILGYLLIEPITHDTKSNKAKYDFQNENDKKLLENSSVKYVNQIAVNKNAKGMKVGSFLYKNFLEKHTRETILLAVVTGPIKNEASFNFHKKFGFDVIGHFKREKYREIKNYESVLFARNKEKGL